MSTRDLWSDSTLQSCRKNWRWITFSIVVVALLAGRVLVALVWQQSTYAASSGDWPGYMFDNGHSGFNAMETILNPTSAPHIKVHWAVQGGGATFSQPVVASGSVYWGSSDGYERAATLSGSMLWQQNLGQTSLTCHAKTTTLGVISTATVASVFINGTQTAVVFVGGGDDHLYALDASTGGILWSTPLGAPSSNTFIWDSPVVYNGSVYIGSASIGDCPLIAGQLFRLDAATGTIENTFNVVPAGCIGGGIWGSPTIDASDNALYFATGNALRRCEKTASNAIALVKLRATDLSFLSSWQIPPSQRGQDSDFGSTPTLFQATIGGALQQLVGVVNKNGMFYTFDRTNVSNGPVWKAQISVGGVSPEKGQGSISPDAWDGNILYVAGGKTTIQGKSCKGSLRALNPIDGSFLWQSCLGGTVLGAVTVVPGVVAVVGGTSLVLVNAASGVTLFTSQGSFYGSPSVSNGVLYVGDQNGHLYAFGT